MNPLAKQFSNMGLLVSFFFFFNRCTISQLLHLVQILRPLPYIVQNDRLRNWLRNVPDLDEAMFVLYSFFLNEIVQYLKVTAFKRVAFVSFL